MYAFFWYVPFDSYAAFNNNVLFFNFMKRMLDALKERGNLQKRCWNCKQKKLRNLQNQANWQNPRANLWLIKIMVTVFMVMGFLMNDCRLRNSCSQKHNSFIDFCFCLVFIS